MLHFTQTLKDHSHWIMVLVIFNFLSLSKVQAQIVDTVFMNNTGHDASTWWNGGCSWPNSINGGSGEFMQCQRWTWYSLSCGEGEQVPHIRFDLPIVPTGYTLDKVELQLHFPTGNPFPHTTGNSQMYVQRLTDHWHEDTISWINRPSFTTANQVSVPAASFSTQSYRIDITDIADLWYTGTSNHGVRLKLQNPSTYRRTTFASSEHPDPALRPRIYFTFLPNTGIITTTVSDTLICNGTSSDIQVNTHGMVSPTFAWSSIPAGFSSTSSNITVYPTQNTQYVVAVTDTGVTLYDTINVGVYECCSVDNTPYKKFHKSFMGLVDASHGHVIGGRGDLTATGDLLMASGTSSSGTGEALLSKINPNGNYNWTRAYDLPDYEAGLSALELSTGDYLLVGHTSSMSSGGVTLFMKKVDASGSNIIWSRNYDQTLFDVVTAFVTELTNGDIVVAALGADGTGKGIAVSHFDDQGFISTYDFKSIMGKGDLVVNDLLATSDGGFVICGEAMAGSANDFDGALLMKFDNSAALIWTQVYRYPSTSGIYNLSSFNPDDISITRAYSVLEDVGNQRFIVVGDASNRFTFNDALIWEVNALTGTFISSEKVNYSGHEAAYTGLSRNNGTGEYLMTGYVQDASTSTELTLLAQCDNSFNFNLHKAYGTPSANPIHRGVDVFQYPNSADLLIHGRSIEPFMTPGTQAQPYAIRTDLNGANGCDLNRAPTTTSVFLDAFSESELPNPFFYTTLFTPFPDHDFCGTWGDVCAPSLRVQPISTTNTLNHVEGAQANTNLSLSNDDQDNSLSFSMIPNPASNYVELSLNAQGVESFDLSLINSNGQVVMELKSLSANSNHKLDVTALPVGLYILNLGNESGILKREKLLISKN